MSLLKVVTLDVRYVVAPKQAWSPWKHDKVVRRCSIHSEDGSKSQGAKLLWRLSLRVMSASNGGTGSCASSASGYLHHRGLQWSQGPNEVEEDASQVPANIRTTWNTWRPWKSSLNHSIPAHRFSPRAFAFFLINCFLKNNYFIVKKQLDKKLKHQQSTETKYCSDCTQLWWLEGADHRYVASTSELRCLAKKTSQKAVKAEKYTESQKYLLSFIKHIFKSILIYYMHIYRIFLRSR